MNGRTYQQMSLFYFLRFETTHPNHKEQARQGQTIDRI